MDLSHPLDEFAVGGSGAASERRWIERINSQFPELRLGVEGRDFRASYRGAATRELQISDIAASAHDTDRHATVSDTGIGLCKLSVQLEGTGVLRQGDRELALAPGTITLYDAARPYSLWFPGDMRFIVAMLPKSALALPAGLTSELAARRLDGPDPTSVSLAALLVQLGEHVDSMLMPAAERLSRVAIDLVNLRLADPDLGPRPIARSLHVSVRSLHKSFEATGTTLSSWIRERRLREARRDLVDPLRLGDPISEIAHARGFDDLSLFIRRFRERFGESPSQCRERVVA